MDYVSDSDAENSLPLMQGSAVDVDLLREVYSFFSSSTRSQIREEASGSPFAPIYDAIDSSLTDASPPSSLQLGDSNHSAGLQEINVSQEPSVHSTVPSTSQNSAPENSPNSPNHPHVIETPKVASEPIFSSRSLRKRTFSSRHPYIADQADWLGICTVDSINEMFSENDNIVQVCKALNQLYLQKKKRFPDEDRYRSKSFYAHLGNNKIFVLSENLEDEQGQADSLNQESQHHDSEEEYASENDADMIPYDGFEIPFSQESFSPPAGLDQNDILRTINEGADHDSSDDSDQAEIREESESDSSDNSEAEEQLIRVGGRYRKLSTILRGVLPESAKRLQDFQKTAPRKKRKPQPNLPPRKGLAVRKVGTIRHGTSELEKELSLLAEKNDEPIRAASPDQPLLHFSRGRSENSRATETIPKIPLLRTASSFGYKSETPDSLIVSISSGSENESDIETVYSEKLSAITPGYQERIPKDTVRLASHSFDDEVQEVDTIDRLLSSKSNSRRSKIASTQKRSSNGRTSIRAKVSTQRLPIKKQSRLGTSRIDLRKLSKRKHALQQSRIRGTVGRQAPTFMRPPFQAALQSKNIQTETKEEKPVAKKKSYQDEFAIQGHSHLFRRNPMVATSAFEVEASHAQMEPPRPAFKSLNPQLFVPSRESLSSSSSLLSLIGTADIIKASAIQGGQIFFQNMDSISFFLIGKNFEFSRINPQESAKSLAKFFSFCRRLLDSDQLSNELARNELQDAFKKIIQWLLISKEKGSEQLWKNLRMTMEHFSKLQTKEVRRSQSVFHSQLLYIFWILFKLEVTIERVSNTHKASMLEEKFSQELDKYALDFWITIFQTFSGDEFKESLGNEDHFSSVSLVKAIYASQEQSWWPPISEALEIVLGIENMDTRPMNIILALASMARVEDRSWAPILAVLNYLKSQNFSRGVHFFIDICTLLKRKLSWRLEERVILQLYTQFASRKFANFPDENEVPHSLGFVRSRQDIPERSAFERFMGLTYEYLSDLDSLKEAKKLISKLLATSQYHYFKGKKSQVMFVNRMNLIILFSQISEVDLGNQFLNLVEQVRNSHDAFVYGRSLDALHVLCEVSKSKDKPIPLKAFTLFFDIFNQSKSLPGIHDLYKRFLSHVGFVFQGTACNTKSGVFDLLQILGELDLSLVSDEFKLDILGITFLSTQELVSVKLEDITARQRDAMVKFNGSFFKFMSNQMSRLPIAPEEADEFLEELIEFSLEIWIVTSKLLGMSHWNMMMLQKYSYAGNSISRNRFIMFFCVEYLNHCPMDQVPFIELDKILLSGMLVPHLSKYALDLYVKLNKNKRSIFCLKSMQDINSVHTLQTYRLQIISRIVYNLGSTDLVNSHERDALISDLIRRLHEEYDQHFRDSIYSEMCKKILESVARYTSVSVNESSEFWELSARLGLPNKWMHDNWRNSDDTQKVYLLNREFLCALAGDETAYIRAIDNWVNADNNELLYGLIQVYCSALTLNERYWAHVSLLLSALVHKLKRFQIAIRERAFGVFLSSLVELAIFSRRNDSKFLAYELNALNTCSEIFEEVFLLYDGYKDKFEIEDLVRQFAAGYDTKRPKQFKFSITFTDITVERIRQYHTANFPKLLKAPNNINKALQECDSTINHLANKGQLASLSEDHTIPEFDFQF